MDREMVVRAAGLYLPLLAAGALWAWRRPARREGAGVLLACAWNLWAVPAINLAALHLGWWRFDASEGVFQGMPVELWLGWVALWGAVAPLVLRRIPIPVAVLLAVWADVLVMPLCAPVLVLGEWWLPGEAAAVAVALVPGLLLARWTAEDRRLRARVVLQAVACGALLLWLGPAAVFAQVGGGWSALLDRPAWLTSLLLQLLAVPALVGLSAVQEFARRGGGTPLPFDPPKRLVTSGPYAYVANPMQLSAALVLLGWGALLGSAWVMLAAGMVAAFFAGLAAWDEGENLRERFGERWSEYRREVRPWVPRWRPWGGVRKYESARYESAGGGESGRGAGDGREGEVEVGDPDSSARVAEARLYVAEGCGPCSEVARWFAARGPAGLRVVAAERHPTRDLRRITYDPCDGGPEDEGVAAVGRALEHVNAGWALVGMLLRLPAVRPLAQALTDASGGGPRPVRRYALAGNPAEGTEGGAGVCAR